MNTRLNISYIDRSSGLTKTEHPFASGFLFWSYNTAIGRLLTRFILNRRFVSNICGWLARQKISRSFIEPFMRKSNKDPNISLISPEDFGCFNDFFTRNVNLAERPVDNNSGSLIAPADGKLLAYPEVSRDDLFVVKRNIFNLKTFLANDILARRFSGGAMIVIRLSLYDYHHFHFPDSGIPREAIAVGRKYYAGGSYDLEKPNPFFGENFRMVTLFDSTNFGPMVQVEVGAFTVGSIKQIFRPNHFVGKGDKKGYFELGGSTVVLLFARDKLIIDADLILNTERGMETKICFGEKIGISFSDNSRRREVAVV